MISTMEECSETAFHIYINIRRFWLSSLSMALKTSMIHFRKSKFRSILIQGKIKGGIATWSLAFSVNLVLLLKLEKILHMQSLILFLG